MDEWIEEPVCNSCDQPIIGGKGDWWHVALGGGYGDMRGPGGHLASPKRVKRDRQSTIQALEERIAERKRQLAGLRALLSADEQALHELTEP